MNNHAAKVLLLSWGISLIFACSPKEEERPAPVVVDKEQIKKEIQEKENQFAELYNSGKLKEIGYYADDAITFFQNRAPIKTMEDRLAFFESDIASNPNIISFTTNEVFISNDGIHVVEIGSYNVVDSTKTTINSGNYMSLFEKRNGKYVCIRDMSASDMPLE